MKLIKQSSCKQYSCEVPALLQVIMRSIWTHPCTSNPFICLLHLNDSVPFQVELRLWEPQCWMTSKHWSENREWLIALLSLNRTKVQHTDYHRIQTIFRERYQYHFSWNRSLLSYRQHTHIKHKHNKYTIRQSRTIKEYTVWL